MRRKMVLQAVAMSNVRNLKLVEHEILMFSAMQLCWNKIFEVQLLQFVRLVRLQFLQAKHPGAYSLPACQKGHAYSGVMLYYALLYYSVIWQKVCVWCWNTFEKVSGWAWFLFRVISWWEIGRQLYFNIEWSMSIDKWSSPENNNIINIIFNNNKFVQHI